MAGFYFQSISRLYLIPFFCLNFAWMMMMIAGEQRGVIVANVTVIADVITTHKKVEWNEMNIRILKYAKCQVFAFACWNERTSATGWYVTFSKLIFFSLSPFSRIWNLISKSANVLLLHFQHTICMPLRVCMLIFPWI